MLFGAIDKKGKILIPYKYENPGPFKEERALVREANSNEIHIAYRYIDRNDKNYTSGKLVSASSSNFSEGLAYISYFEGDPMLNHKK